MADHTLLVILGPTAVGKTEFSLCAAEAFGADIISADSRQMYKEMEIGTAVPSSEERNRVTHHFIGNKSIYDYYTAGMFELDVLALLDQLFKKKRVAILTGGSGLYIHAVCHGIDALPKPDKNIRDHLNKIYTEKGLESLINMLKDLDPVSYQKIDLNNPKRVLKALEITLTTGRAYASFLTRESKTRSFDYLKIGLNRERKALYDRINQRVDQMIENGLIQEARRLYPDNHLNALNTVGYKELFDYFEGKISFQEAVRLIKRNTRRYAKRQLTWFAKDKEITWFHPEERGKVLHFIQQHLSKYNQ